MKIGGDGRSEVGDGERGWLVEQELLLLGSCLRTSYSKTRHVPAAAVMGD